MDLNARVDVNFARMDGNFQTVTVRPNSIIILFHFDTNQHQGPTNTQNKISATYTLLFWRNGFQC